MEPDASQAQRAAARELLFQRLQRMQRTQEGAVMYGDTDSLIVSGAPPLLGKPVHETTLPLAAGRKRYAGRPARQ